MVGTDVCSKTLLPCCVRGQGATATGTEIGCGVVARRGPVPPQLWNDASDSAFGQSRQLLVHDVPELLRACDGRRRIVAGRILLPIPNNTRRRLRGNVGSRVDGGPRAIDIERSTTVIRINRKVLHNAASSDRETPTATGVRASVVVV